MACEHRTSHCTSCGGSDCADCDRFIQELAAAKLQIEELKKDQAGRIEALKTLARTLQNAHAAHEKTLDQVALMRKALQDIVTTGEISKEDGPGGYGDTMRVHDCWAVATKALIDPPA